LVTVELLATATHLDANDKESFLVVANEIVAEGDVTIADFLSALMEFRVTPQPGPKKDVNGPVRLMTLRQAKGLSAPVVIVTDLDDEIVPGGFDADHVNEQRPLLYVSMTRAERLLYLVYCGHRARHVSRWAGTGSQRRPRDRRTISRFLDGLTIQHFTIAQLIRGGLFTRWRCAAVGATQHGDGIVALSTAMHVVTRTVNPSR